MTEFLTAKHGLPLAARAAAGRAIPRGGGILTGLEVLLWPRELLTGEQEALAKARLRDAPPVPKRDLRDYRAQAGKLLEGSFDKTHTPLSWIQHRFKAQGTPLTPGDIAREFPTEQLQRDWARDALAFELQQMQEPPVELDEDLARRAAGKK